MAIQCTKSLRNAARTPCLPFSKILQRKNKLRKLFGKRRDARSSLIRYPRSCSLKDCNVCKRGEVLDRETPYLLIFLSSCLEFLSNLINKEVEDKKWSGLKVLNTRTTISHLIFAHNLMLFCKATDTNCRKVMETLNTFCGASGLNINFSKSKFYTSLNVPRRNVNAFSAISGMTMTKDLWYLPLCSYLVDSKKAISTL